MAIKVLVVDDSSFFRRRMSEIINADPRLTVVGNATNGKEACELVKVLQPDVITMDIEMPVMDGITAVREIMKIAPTPILMFSSLTQAGAKATLDALDAGALDFLPKKFEDIARNRDEAVDLLQKRVAELAGKRFYLRRNNGASSAIKPVSTPSVRATVAMMPNVATTTNTRISTGATSTSRAVTGAVITPKIPLRFRASGKKYQLVAIGTSTGGPVALQQILTQLPANFPSPILLVQHMPMSFTPAFAVRLNNLCRIEVKEAQDGDILRAGVAYLAPGGQQMMVDGRAPNARLRIIDSGERIGVGKTTTTIALAGLLSEQNQRVLVVDTDPHGSLTTYLNFDADYVPASLFDLFQLPEIDRDGVRKLILSTTFNNIDIIPAHMSLATLDRSMGNRSGMGLVLKKALHSVAADYDYVLIDCPPILGVMMVNALAASDRILIPVQTEFLAMKGLERMLRTLQIMQRSKPTEFDVTIIPTMYDKRTRASLQTLQDLKTRYPDQVWTSAIPIDTKFRDASIKHMPPSLYAHNCRGVFAYKTLLSHLTRLAHNE
jgi:chemotaxis response regulator CheB/cellulose biosynthesis protein BcsQ